MNIEFDDNELASLRYILINASGAGITMAITHPLLTKIMLAAQQRGNGDATQARGPESGLGEHSRTVSSRFATEIEGADHSDSRERGSSRQARRPE